MLFLDKIKNTFKEEDYLEIKTAFDFASNAHAGQFRKTGEPYITHPIAVATILVDLGLDVDTIIAGLLHDVVEDTKYTIDDVKQKFGNAIAEMVEGVTKLSNLPIEIDPAARMKIEQAETIRKLFFAMAKDIRVIMVKLADRLHNMRTISILQEKTILRKASETLDIYAPLAGRLGISSIKDELEDLSMKYLYPDAYQYLAEKLDSQITNRLKVVEKISNILNEQLKGTIENYEIKGRPKHYYSIYKKMKSQNKSLDEIYDLIALRIIVNTVSDCYAVLGLVHALWKPIAGRFKDYIANPKPNMYQSLHTTIITDFGEIFEVQIRTFEMNKIAEYGIAAHWKYKEGISSKSMSEFDKKLGWIKEMMDLQQDISDSEDFLNTVKVNVASEEVYIFTPKGTVVDLPKGATAVDFAYKIHSEIGNHCVGAKINGKMKPLSTVLENNNVVEIITNNASNGPSRDWLNFVITPGAKSKIKAFFKKAMREENIKLGKEMLELEAKKRNYNINDLIKEPIMKVIFETYSFDDYDEFYSAIGCNGIKVQAVVSKLLDYYNKTNKTSNNPSITPTTKKYYSNSNGILIDGFDGFLIKIAKCCSPLPGDDIIGYISRGRGIMVHKNNCPNLTNLEKERLINATWEQKNDSLFNAPLHIEVDISNATKSIAGITALLSKLNVKTIAFNTMVSKDNQYMIIKMTLEINSKEDLSRIIDKIKVLRGVQKVSRET
ncbi:MAG: bifunctional (p)ppGpp synthetase/guanosine-3',5'-bis(diphosphate) 3'-pyrophosphohydrolase [Clostridia bacterium]|nr:bifunctional (p)ppGpp synthetase/guanosine-3',5'-bis(diphosphate) 3'-pyrophosphohydrolase [Clostridia bacterium]